jgi:hypothetical protein
LQHLSGLSKLLTWLPVASQEQLHEAARSHADLIAQRDMFKREHDEMASKYVVGPCGVRAAEAWTLQLAWI